MALVNRHNPFKFLPNSFRIITSLTFTNKPTQIKVQGQDRQQGLCCCYHSYLSLSLPVKHHNYHSQLSRCDLKNFHRKKFHTSQFAYNKNSYDYKGNFLARFSEDIDFDAIRKERKQLLLKNSDNTIRTNDIIKEILKRKCDEAISNLDQEDEKKLRVIQLEHDFLFSEGYSIPCKEDMTSENWLEALNYDSKNKRLKYYFSVQRKINTKQNDKDVKALKESEESEKRLCINKIFVRTYDSTMKRWDNHRLSASMKFGIPLVIDMDFEDYMNQRDMKNTAKQVLEMYSRNRSDEKEAFHLHLTSCPENNSVYRTLQIFLNDDPNFLATVTEDSYLDLFDKERLVYLSPNGKKVLRKFDSNAVYIIGAFNDRGLPKPITYARAQEQEIACQRLPIDEYLDWGCGNKALTLDQMMKIMLEIKNNKSWPEAFKHIPTRKLKPGSYY